MAQINDNKGATRPLYQSFADGERALAALLEVVFIVQCNLRADYNAN
jgi:hypothetical protein